MVVVLSFFGGCGGGFAECGGLFNVHCLQSSDSGGDRVFFFLLSWPATVVISCIILVCSCSGCQLGFRSWCSYHRLLESTKSARSPFLILTIGAPTVHVWAIGVGLLLLGFGWGFWAWLGVWFDVGRYDSLGSKRWCFATSIYYLVIWVWPTLMMCIVVKTYQWVFNYTTNVCSAV